MKILVILVENSCALLQELPIQIQNQNTFSFNSPKGACSKCNGLGITNEINFNKVIPDNSISIKSGGIIPLGEEKNSWIFKQLHLIADRYHFKLSDSIKSIPEEALKIILYGGNEKFSNCF